MVRSQLVKSKSSEQPKPVVKESTKKSYSNCSSMLGSGRIQDHFMLSGFVNPYVSSGDIRGVWMGSNNSCKNPGIVHIHKYGSNPRMFEIKTCFPDGTFIESKFASNE